MTTDAAGTVMFRQAQQPPPKCARAEGFGLMFYNARWYDVQLGRFAQADTIIPLQTQGVQAWDRYAYVNNNPLRYTDPSGHYACLDYGFCFPESSPGNAQNTGTSTGGNYADSESAAYEIISKLDNPVARGTAHAAARYYFTVWKVDAWLYHNVPSGFSYTTINISAAGGGLAGSVSETTYIFNWRSMELDKYKLATDVGVGVPGVAGNFAGIGTIYGASSNSSIEGLSLSYSMGGYAPVGGVITNSRALKSPAQILASALTGKSIFYVDPKSGLNVTSSTLFVGVGNPGVVGSFTLSHSGIGHSIFDLNLPFSIIPNNNPYLP